MSANMKIGAADPAAIVRLAADNQVDVVAVQEFTYQAQSALSAAGIARLFPYSEQDPAYGASGSALFSRYPLTQTGHTALGDAFEQAYGVVTVPGAQPVYVRSIHPLAPTVPVNIPHLQRALAAEPPATPHGQVRILIGDFNSTLDHAFLRKLIGTGYHDAAAELGDGLVPTWPYDGRPVPRVSLDHVLVDPRIGVSTFSAHQVARTDHRSIIATLTLPPA
jgi:endonuclease/exonuclease/phosphatase family metal-dependent hydrolase